MGHYGHTTPRKKRAKQFLSTKKKHDLRQQMYAVEDEVKCLTNIARQRSLSLEEGRELNRLSTKLRRLRRKMGLQENWDAQ